eukprot:tig00000718_g3708.t1
MMPAFSVAPFAPAGQAFGAFRSPMTGPRSVGQSSFRGRRVAAAAAVAARQPAACAAPRFGAAEAMLRDKTVVITGCSKGIGAEFVRQLFEHRVARVVGLVRDPSAAGVKRLEADFGDKFEAVRADVGSEDSIKAAAAEVLRKTDRVDILINCAGVWSRAGFDTVTSEHMVELFRVNALGPMLVARELLPAIRAAARAGDHGDVHAGLILNLTSKMGSTEDNSSGNSYAYRASKCALNIINKSLSIDFAPEGITSVLLHPGYVRTDMTSGQGLINPDESVRGLIGVIEGLEYADNGCWFDFKGVEIPW